MVKISACVIVKNEEAHIEQWLHTMRKITKDLIVVDTGSTDRTVALAKAGGAQLYHFAWIDDFSAAKNHAIEQAKGDWIIFLDADEYFTEKSLPHVRKVIEKQHHNPKTDALVCKIIDIDADKNNEPIDEFYNLRIFRNVSWLRYQNKVHEQLVKSRGKLQLAVVENDIEILHTGYTQSIIKQKLERNLALLKKEIAEHGECPWHYRFLCECYCGLEQYELAVKYARLHMAKGARSLGKDNKMQKLLIEALDGMKVGEEALLAEVETQRAAFPDDPEFLWYKGEYLTRLGQYAQAEVYFAQMFAMKERQKADFDATSFERGKMRAYNRLAQIAEKKVDYVAAEAYALQALRCAKYNEALFLRWYRWLRQKQPVEVIGALQSVYDKTERDLLFVYKLLQAFPRNQVHLYYQRVLKETLDIQAITSATADWLAVGQYGRVAADLKESMEFEYALLLVCTALEKNTRSGEQEQLLLPASHEKVARVVSGEKLVLTREEAHLYETVQNCVAACKNDLQQPIEALRARYLKARQTAVPVATVAEEAETRLLDCLAPDPRRIQLLTIDCNAKVMTQLHALYPQAVFHETAGDFLAEKTEESFQCIVMGSCLNVYRGPFQVLAKLYSLLAPEGVLLFSVDNARYWGNLTLLFDTDERVTSAKNLLRGDAALTRELLIQGMRAAAIPDFVIIPEKVTPVAEAKQLLRKLQNTGFRMCEEEFYTQCWNVRASQAKRVPNVPENSLLPETEEKILCLLRQIEAGREVSESCAKILASCRENLADTSLLAEIIDSKLVQKTRIFVQLATFFFQQEERKFALRLLIAAWKRYPQKADIVYALAFLSHLNGSRQDALKILEQFQGKDAAIEELRKELQ